MSALCLLAADVSRGSRRTASQPAFRRSALTSVSICSAADAAVAASAVGGPPSRPMRPVSNAITLWGDGDHAKE